MFNLYVPEGAVDENETVPSQFNVVDDTLLQTLFQGPHSLKILLKEPEPPSWEIVTIPDASLLIPMVEETVNATPTLSPGRTLVGKRRSEIWGRVSAMVVVVVDEVVVVVVDEVVVVVDFLLFFFFQTNTFPTLLQTNGFFNVPLTAPGR